MASYSFKLTAIFILATVTCSSSAAKETTMSLYFQDYSGGPNATVMQVNHGGLSGDDGALKFFEFGSLFVTDDPITEEFDSGSAVVARGQGLYVTSALDGKIAHVVISVVFTGGEFSGSTLQIQGASPQLEKVREVAVVGGTGIFRFARGYATFETVHFNLENHHVVIQFNATVQHY
nr:dirigent protein 22-like [Ipomoea batatas]